MAKETATDLFWDAFTVGGSNRVDCVCGREHFTRKTDNWEDEDEIVGLLNRECGMPDRVIGTDDDSVSYASVNGIVICYGCPCGSSAKYENFIVNEQKSIMDYYKRLTVKKREELASLTSGISDLETP